MRISVLYFATLRDRAGTRSEELDLPEGSTVGDLKTALGLEHNALAEALDSALFSVNREFAFPAELLNDGDEVGVFPPVSGGTAAEGPTVLRMTEAALDLNDMIDAIILPETGAVCSFTGIVRGRTERVEPHETDYLDYEAYESMAEAKMRQVAAEIRERWDAVQGILIIQRTGRLYPGTPTVLIACSAGHRDTGVFEAARYGIDRLKEIVPIWKRETGPEGQVWVEGRYVPGETDRRE